jgi:hypothetical protein
MEPAAQPPAEPREARGLLPTVDWEHRQRLLQRRRCGWCAEHVPARLVLEGGSCPHCETSLYPQQDLDAEAVIEALRKRWNRWKWPVWGLITLGTFVGAFIPLVSAPILFVGLVGLHLGLVRKPLQWLSTGRRFSSRFLLRLILAFLSFLNLVVSALAWVVPVLGPLLAALCSVLSAVFYTELALRLITNRLRRETVKTSMDTWEWMLPAGILGGLVVSALSLVGLTAGALYGLLWMDIPGVSDIAAFLLSTGGS